MKSIHLILILVVLVLCYERAWGFSSTSKSLNTLVSLKPLDTLGVYRLGSGRNAKELDAVFLGRPKLDVLSDEGDSGSAVTVCDLVPLLISKPVFSDKDQWAVSSLAPNPLVNRDAGLYDSIPYAWGVKNKPEDDPLLRAQEIKKQVFNKCAICKGNPGEAFLTALKSVLDIEVTGLFIEVADEYGGEKGGVVLGAGAVVARSGVAEQYAMPGGILCSAKDLAGLPSNRPSVDSNKAQERLVQRFEADGEGEAAAVQCYLDEVVGLSRTLGLPIMAPKGLVERVCEDGRLTNRPMRLSAPARFRRGSDEGEEEGEGQEEEDVEKVWTIYNPQEFVAMSQVQKRDLLRASGVRSLPRPREGTAALDSMLTEFMDAAVRSEYQRLSVNSPKLSEIASGGDQNRPRRGNVWTDEQIKTEDRGSLLRRMGEALDDGDIELATKLREAFAFKTALKADATQAHGSYDPYLDQDEWYMEQRRRAMAPKKK